MSRYGGQCNSTAGRSFRETYFSLLFIASSVHGFSLNAWDAVEICRERLTFAMTPINSIKQSVSFSRDSNGFGENSARVTQMHKYKHIIWTTQNVSFPEQNEQISVKEIRSIQEWSEHLKKSTATINAAKLWSSRTVVRQCTLPWRGQLPHSKLCSCVPIAHFVMFIRIPYREKTPFIMSIDPKPEMETGDRLWRHRKHPKLHFFTIELQQILQVFPETNHYCCRTCYFQKIQN